MESPISCSCAERARREEALRHSHLYKKIEELEKFIVDLHLSPNEARDKLTDWYDRYQDVKANPYNALKYLVPDFSKLTKRT